VSLSLLVICPNFIEVCTNIASQDSISPTYCLIALCICTNAAATITNRSGSIGIGSGGGGGDDDSSSSSNSSGSIFNNDKFAKIPGIRHPCKIVKRHGNCHQLR